MDMMGKIRRLHFRGRLSFSEIARRTGLSRNTIRKYLREGEAAGLRVVIAGDRSVLVGRTGSALRTRFVLDLPEVTADEVELSRHDDALQLSAHGTMRVVPLPPGLRRCAVERAGLAGGRLTLDLVPDPARWPR